MNFAENLNDFFMKQFNAGGTDHVPPACYLPSAYAPARAAAYVERTGRAVLDEVRLGGVVGHLGVKSLICRLEAVL